MDSSNTIFRCRFKNYDTRTFITMSVKIVPFVPTRSGYHYITYKTRSYTLNKASTRETYVTKNFTLQNQSTNEGGNMTNTFKDFCPTTTQNFSPGNCPYSIILLSSLSYSTLVSHFPFIISPYSPTTLSSFSNQPEYIICIFPLLPGSNGAREIRLQRYMQPNSFQLFKEKIV